MSSYILTIDLGGTKCCLSLWQSSCAAVPQKVSSHTVPTDFADEQGLLAKIQSFLLYISSKQAPSQPVKPEACTLAMAGRIAPGAAELSLTNNPCQIHTGRLREGLNCPLAVLNDLEALAHALPALSEAPNPQEPDKPAQLRQIYPQKAANFARFTPPFLHNSMHNAPGFSAPAIAAAVGTGLGVAARLPGGRVVPTEAGHCAFAPENPDQLRLWRALREHQSSLPTNALNQPEPASGPFPYPFNEQILSGMGLCNILYTILPSAPKPLLQNPALISLCAQGCTNLHSICTASAPYNPDYNIDYNSEELQTACREAFRLLSSCLGACMSNLALTFLAGGGVYLGGGVLTKNPTLFDEQAFIEAFLKPGAFRQTLSQIPVWLIQDPDALSLGAALFADHNILG